MGWDGWNPSQIILRSVNTHVIIAYSHNSAFWNYHRAF